MAVPEGCHRDILLRNGADVHFVCAIAPEYTPNALRIVANILETYQRYIATAASPLGLLESEDEPARLACWPP